MENQQKKCFPINFCKLTRTIIKKYKKASTLQSLAVLRLLSQLTENNKIHLLHYIIIL